MDKNIKKHFLKYIANLFFAIICILLSTINISLAEDSTIQNIQKCTTFYTKNDNDERDIRDIEACRSNSENIPNVQSNEGTYLPISELPYESMKKDDEGNVTLYCQNIKKHKSNDIGESLQTEKQIKDIDKYFNHIKLCGDGWNTFGYTKNSIKKYIYNTNYWYPEYGAYSDSYEYILNKVLSGKYNCDDTIKEQNEIDFCLNKDHINDTQCASFKRKCLPTLLLGNNHCELEDCSNVKKTTRNIKNKFYREYIYNGMEFEIPIAANEIDKHYDSIESVYNKGDGCFDPRLPEEKGYNSSKQRYYFRGKLKANYACERFSYNGNKTCVDTNGGEISDPQKCKKLFHLAKKCCEHRRDGGVCIYYSPDEDNYKDLDNISSFEKYKKNGFERFDRSNLKGRIAFCSNYNTYMESNKCLLYTGSKRVKLRSYYGKLDDGYFPSQGKKNTNKICVKTENLQPYNFNLLGGTETKDLYCDGDYIYCKNPFENKEEWKKKKWENNYGEDLKKIFDEDNNETPPYGKVKNFCTYDVHCVESSKEITAYGSTSFGIQPANVFFPLVCFDFSKTSSQFTTEKNKSFSTPMIECIYETINNMFLNKAGMSSCANPDESVNSEGLCGADTFSMPESIRHKKYNANYRGPEAYEYMIGEELPKEYNIFRKIQAGVQNIIKTAMVIAIAIISFKFLIKGELNIFDIKHGKALVVGMLKFVIVIYFAISNAWQAHFYKWLDTAIKYSYQKAFNLSLSSLNPTGKMQDREVICDLIEKNHTEQTAKAFQCSEYKINYTPNIGYQYFYIGSKTKTETELGLGREPTEKDEIEIGKYKYKNCKKSNEEGKVMDTSEETKDQIITDEEIKSRVLFILEKNGLEEGSINNEIERVTVTENNIEKNTKTEIYKNCKATPKDNNIYSYAYDGCYFGDAKYPEGKEYLSVFDNLDCKLTNYLHLSTKHNGHFIFIIIITFFFAKAGIFLFLLSVLFLLLIFSILFKISYLFIVNFLSINILIFVSPIAFPTLLFEKYKGIFDEWLKSLMGFSLQLIVVLIFAGLFVGTIDRIGLGGAKYINHDSETGRNPQLICPTNASTSVLCIFSPDAAGLSKTSTFTQKIFQLLGLGNVTYTIESIKGNGFYNTLFTLINFVIVLILFYNLLDKVPEIAEKMTDSHSTLNKENGFFIKFTTQTAKTTRNVVTAGRAARLLARGPFRQARKKYLKRREGNESLKKHNQNKTTDTTDKN